ncbi:MAG: hypothetical protein Q9162_000273 [Coniocarpon cinnabarinum]
MHLCRFVVTPTELHEALNEQHDDAHRLVPLSAAWFLPNDPQKRTGLQSFTHQHIPGSRFFDLDAIKDASSPWHHMLPDSKVYANALGRLGIRRNDTVVVYDTAELGIFSAPRVAWTLKVFGHPQTHLLNNFRLWMKEGRPTEKGDLPEVQQEVYEMPQPWSVRESVADFHEMQEIVRDKREDTTQPRGPALVDARPLGRWQGTAPEPRLGMPSGHMPGSVNLAFSDVLDSDTKALFPPEKLRELFSARGIPSDREIISSCGTGVTAAVIDLALAEAGWPADHARRIYDGSWTEWASRLSPEEGWIRKAV